MRTTLDIESDVMIEVKERARRKGISAGRMATILIRSALTNGDVQRSSTDDNDIFEIRNGLPSLKRRGRMVSAAHVQRLIDDDEMVI